MNIIRFPPHAKAKRFEDIFGVSLMSYFNGLTGFDIVKFDDEIIKSADNESIADKIRKEKGDEAVSLVEHLLHYPIFNT